MTLLVLGGINEDVVFHVEALPRPGETVMALGVNRTAGGKGLNKAVAAARFGGTVSLLGAIGDDPAGAMLRDTLRAAGVNDRQLIVDRVAPSGQAFILLARSGENSIVVNAGANAGLTPDAIGEQANAAKVMLAEFEAPLEVVRALLRAPSAAIRVLNAAPALPEARAILSLADILILNETELEAFAGCGALHEDAAFVAAARQLIAGGAQQVIVTLGKAGCLLVSSEGHDRIAAHAVAAVDTIGAGDCFCGVFAAALVEGMSVRAAIEQANAAAAISVGRRGGAAAAPVRAEIRFLLNGTGG